MRRSLSILSAGTPLRSTATGAEAATCSAMYLSSSRVASCDATSADEAVICTMVASLPLWWRYMPTWPFAPASKRAVRLTFTASPVRAEAPFTYSSTVSLGLDAIGSRSIASMSAAVDCTRCATSDATTLPKSSLRATKSVSHATSRIAPDVPSLKISPPTMPSLVERSERFSAFAMPFLRRYSTAASISPLVSSRAFLQSIMPAPCAGAVQRRPWP